MMYIFADIIYIQMILSYNKKVLILPIYNYIIDTKIVSLHLNIFWIAVTLT